MDTQLMPQVLPKWVRSLAAGMPEAPVGVAPMAPAPPGTIVVLGPNGGWSVPPREYDLVFGRGAAEPVVAPDTPTVHVPVGVGDRCISRCHGRLTWYGSEWWLRNEGRRPILQPDRPMLLEGQERPVEDAFVALFIGDLSRRVHSLEVRLVGGRGDNTACEPGDETISPVIHNLTDVERLVLTAVAKRYLNGEHHPQPASWKQVAEDLNLLPGDKDWNEKSTARVVAGVRDRLSAPDYPHRVLGLTLEEVGDPAGNALNDNLIRALLQSTTLTPADLRRLPHLDD